MTWVALIALPFVILFKAVTTPGVWIYEKCSAPVKPYSETTRRKLTDRPLKPSSSQLVDISEILDSDEVIESAASLIYFVGRANSHRVFAWFTANPNWRETHLPQAKKEVEAVYAALKRKMQKQHEKETKIRKVNILASTCGSAVFKVLIPTLIIALGAAASWGLFKLALMPSLQDYLGASIIAIGGYCLYLFGKIIGSGIVIYIDSRMDRVTPNKPGLASVMCKPIVWSAQKLYSAYEFLAETVTMTYKQECPLIIWGDETGPIEKRKNEI